MNRIAVIAFALAFALVSPAFAGLNENNQGQGQGQLQGQQQGQAQGQGQSQSGYNSQAQGQIGINKNYNSNGQGQGQVALGKVSITNPADDVESAAKELAKQANSAPRATGQSSDGSTPCGDQTGVSGQIGVAGGGLATVSESCRAFRLQRLQEGGQGSLSTTLATVTHYAGWLPRTVLHVASLGVLN